MRKQKAANANAHFHRNKIFELVPRWNKCINVLGHYDTKLLTTMCSKLDTFNFVIYYFKNEL